MKKVLFILVIAIMASCRTTEEKPAKVITTDIDNFWMAYDLIVKESDSLKQIQLIDSLYIKKGTVGLDKIREVREYTAQEYVQMINHYPRYFASLRANTLQANQLAEELNIGIQKLEAVYPHLKPANIYFTMGCMRTNGTTVDSLVLIGSELAMADPQTDISEFEGATKEWLAGFLSTNPLKNLVLLNVHEYVHTQQQPQLNNLLSIAIREGVAEFVSTLAMNTPSASPAVDFGKKNAIAVREKFEVEMFYPNNRPKWFWSNYPNEFGVRDLGYYVGYQMSDNFYQQAENKAEAIKYLIELDFTNEAEVEDFVKKTNYFSAPLDTLYQNFERSRPYVTRVGQFENNSQNVDPSIKQLTVHFSEPLNGQNTGVDLGPLGRAYFPKNEPSQRFWSADNASWSIGVNLEPNTHYQVLISNNFRTSNDIPLKPYLIDFKTGEVRQKT